MGAGAAKAPEEEGEAAFDRTHGGRAGEARSNAQRGRESYKGGRR